MYEKVRAYVKEYAMLKQTDHVITGISGGADSICLLCVLKKLQKEMGFQITGVHVNHGLRGEEADADEAFVKEICRKEEIPLHIFHIDVKQLAKDQGLSAEEAGREARREAFGKVMKKSGGTKIALAHHMNDSVETVLLNLARGTGVKGISGILPVKGEYIRPLLCVQRQEIEKYLEENNIDYCIDRTNLEDIYTRNRIRNHVIPFMESNVNEKTVEHVANLSRQMAELNEFVERRTEAAYLRCVEEGSSFYLDIEMFSKEDVVLKPYILKRLLCRAAGKEKDIEMVHVKLLEKLMSQQTGRAISLPYGLSASRSYGKLVVRPKENVDNGGDQSDVIQNVEMRVFECSKMPDSFPKSPYTKWFDYDIIKNTVVIRNRKSGDYITIDDKGNTQKIKKYFVNAKIPKEQREKVLLAADGNHIMWIVGYRQNQAYQVSENTTRILEIKVERRKKIER